MSTPLATLFTKIGFDIDSASLSRLNKQIDAIQARMRGLANTLNSSGANRAATRLAVSAQERAAAMAELRQRRLTRLEVRAHEINASLERKKQRSEQAAQLRQLRETSRQAAREMRDARQLADFQNREFNLRQRNLDRQARQRQVELRQQQTESRRLHTEALRENRRRSLERFRQMRMEADFLNREFNLRRRNAERERVRAERQQQIQDRLNNRPSLRPSGGGGMAGMGVNAQTAIGTVAGAGFVQQAFKMANFEVSQAPQFEFITGSKENATAEIEFLNKTVDELSLSLSSANVQYRQLLATTYRPLGKQASRDLFEGFSVVSTMMGLTEDAQARGIRAFGQMASKGQIMAEELNFRLAA